MSLTNIDTRPLTVCHCNIRSLLSTGKLTELALLSLQENLDIIAVTETWLTPTVPDSALLLDGYLPPFRRDRARPYGGVAVYVSSKLNATRIYRLESKSVESVWLSVDVLDKRVLLGTYYRPPGQTSHDKELFLQQLSSSVELAIQLKPSVLMLAGDFNDRCTDWNSDHDQSELGLQLYNLFQLFNLYQMIDSPTRFTPATGTNTLLDLLVTDSPRLVVESGVWPPVGTSDHCAVYCRIDFKIKKTKPFSRNIWLYDKANIVNLHQHLSRIQWYEMFSNVDNVDDICSAWSSLFLNICSEHIPNKTVTIHPKDKPWLDRELKLIMRRRNRLWRRWRRTMRADHHAIYKRSS